ncbi:MAG: hypothetical protein JNK46_13030 [Methylobacteriaceae bacterium]|nr:hypothetical protein [Methylobacteriaceae bacterium]
MNAQPQKARQRIAEPQPAPPILIGATGPVEAGGGAARWGLMLVWFMRIVALLWFALGLFYWVWILEPGPGASGSAFLTLPLARQGAIVFFAVMDFVAAIGLWLAAPWGGVVWLFTALTEIVLAALAPELSLGHATALGVNGALIVIYFLLNIFAAREQANA